MLPPDLTLHVQFYLVAGSHYLYLEQCPVVNSDIKGSLEIDSKRENSLKNGCCDTAPQVMEQVKETSLSSLKHYFSLASTVLII